MRTAHVELSEQGGERSLTINDGLVHGVKEAMGDEYEGPRSSAGNAVVGPGKYTCKEVSDPATEGLCDDRAAVAARGELNLCVV